jgi:methionyl-tRNA formyltransferase
MRLVVLIGSPLRAGILRALGKAGFAPAAVLLPVGPRFSGVRERLSDLGWQSAEAVRRAALRERLCQLAPDVALLVGWPHIIEAETVENPPCLLLNSHPALLPEYRGINPWGFVIENGESRTGCTVHRIDEGVDSGPILHREEVSLTAFDTYRSLRNKALQAEEIAVCRALKKLQSGTAEFVAQDESKARLYPKRTPADGELDPKQPLAVLVDRIRAADPERFPAYFYHRGEKVCVRLWRPARPVTEDDDSL